MIKNFAKEKAMQAAKEQTGAYVSRYSKTNNLKLVAYEVKVITSNIIKLVNVDYKKLDYQGVIAKYN